MHFENKEIGSVDSLPGTMDDVPFHIYGMKEPDFVMKLMSTYDTNKWIQTHITKHNYLNSEKKKNHF